MHIRRRMDDYEESEEKFKEDYDFVKQVEIMRNLQKEYFKFRDKSTLIKSKQQEAKVDTLTRLLI